MKRLCPALVGLVLLPLSCMTPAPVSYFPQPDNVETINLRWVEPREQWLEWFREAERCLRADVEEEVVVWFTYEQAGLHKGLWGYSLLDGYRWRDHLYLQEDMVDAEWLVKHEAIHFILDQYGIDTSDTEGQPEHPAFAVCGASRLIRENGE